VRRCHYSDQHLVRDCEQAKKSQNTQEKRPIFQKSRVNQIQVIPTEEVSEETEIKVVMKCGVNLKQSHQEIMPEQMILKQAIRKDNNNALLLSFPLLHASIEACSSGNTRKTMTMTITMPCYYLFHCYMLQLKHAAVETRGKEMDKVSPIKARFRSRDPSY